jgi:phosphatidylinositol alpha-1,6-mannosyltransferase
VRRRLALWGLRSCRFVVANSQWTADRLREFGLSGEKIRVVSGGVDTTVFSPGDRQEARKRLGIGGASVVLCSASRLVPKKGLDFAIRAFHRALGHAPGLRYVVVGEGPERAGLERLCREMGIADKVTFAGAVSHEEVPSYLRAADVYLQPSRVVDDDVETMGRSYCEASACGLPVIAGDSGGVRSVVEDGITGMVVPPESGEKIAEAIAVLAGSPELRRRYGDAARRKAEREFSWHVVAGRIERLGREGG